MDYNKPIQDAYLKKGFKMRLSDDGKTLLSVTNEDITNGTFTTPEGVNIGTATFFGCTSPALVTIPEGVTINPAAFAGCTGLTKAIIHERVNIGLAAFMKCVNLRSRVQIVQHNKELHMHTESYVYLLANKHTITSCIPASPVI
jgi:BspA type Leucine rich repeat region (6 copies)